MVRALPQVYKLPPKRLPFPWACPTLCKYTINSNWVIVRLLYIIYTLVYCFVCYIMCPKTGWIRFKPVLQRFSKISKRSGLLTEPTVSVDHFFRKMDRTEAWTAVQSGSVFGPMDWTLKHYLSSMILICLVSKDYMWLASDCFSRSSINPSHIPVHLWRGSLSLVTVHVKIPKCGWLSQIFDGHGERIMSIVHLDAILRSAHLMGIAGVHHIPRHLLHTDSLDAFKSFYVIKFIDYHAHEIAF
jgi:hypothetical protein